MSVLADNLTLYGLDPTYGSDYINLQLIYNRQMNDEHLQCALSTAAEKLEIPLDVQVHDALNDAYLTFEVCQKLDMTLGLAEYSEYVAALPAPIAKDAVQNINDLKKMIFNRRVVDIRCPKCGSRLELGQWLFSSGKSCKTIAHCETDGDFLIKLKAVKVSEGDYTVTRSVFAASEDDIKSFNEKIKKREERRKKAREKPVQEQSDSNA